MILADTCVLIDAAKRPQRKLQARLASMPIAICGVVRAEMLCGAYLPTDRARITASLAGFIELDVSRTTWVLLGTQLGLLRKAGLSPSFSDALIATLAIEAGLELWTRDAHFVQMQAALPGLVLYAEPP